MGHPPTLVLFLGGLRGSPVEEMVALARCAAALDSAEAALSSGAFTGAVLVTDDASIDANLPGLALDVDLAPFHFGSRLAGVVRRHDLDSIVYMGGGSVPLFGRDDFAGVAKSLGDGIVTNNAFSSDLVAWSASDTALAALETLDRDNGLARALQEHAGLVLQELPRSVATQMDIDGPSDLAVLALTGGGGTRLQAYLTTLALDQRRHERALPLFSDREAQIVVAGRAGSHSWQYLERETACRVRLFAEERGLEVDGRAQTGSARSLLGFFIETASIERFFDVLPELGDAAFIDTRVLLAHMRIEASRQDRFLSDLGAWSKIRDSFLRDFTRAAVDTRIPVLLGGHSLMSGGLMALNEFAWRQNDFHRSD